MSTETEPAGADFLGYRIEEEIARGGMGVVYRAYDRRLKRTVALKFVAPELAADERFRERFLREVEIAASLEHPNVVPIHDAGEDEGRVYLAMRYVEGTTLGALLRAEGALDPPRALAICSQVARALDAAHGGGLVHRDVKPSNVLLDASEHVYLADFGLSRRVADSARFGDGRSLGTPAYIAPEQLAGEQVDGRVDVYSLGCLLLECLTGKPPFAHASPLAVAWAHLEHDPPEASKQNALLPPELDAVIAKAMAKEPDDRYGTSGELVAAAERALGRRARRRSAVLVAIATVLLLLAATGTVAALVLTSDHTRRPPEVLPNSLVRIDPDTLEPTQVVEIGPRADLVVAAGRYVWVTHAVLRYTNNEGLRDAGDRTLTRVDPSTGKARVVGGGLAPCGLAADPSGDVWVANCFAQGSSANVVRVDAKTLEFEATYPVPAGRGVFRGLAYGGGSLWVGDVRDTADSQTLTQINPRTGARRSLPLDGHAAWLTWSERYGDLWMNDFEGGSVTRLHAESGAVKMFPSLGIHPGGGVVEGNAFWVGDWLNPRVVRLPAAGTGKRRLVSLPTTVRPAGVTLVAAGAGSVWAAVPDDRAVWHIDPKTNDATRIPVRYFPWGVSVGDDGIWVAVRGHDA